MQYFFFLSEKDVRKVVIKGNLLDLYTIGNLQNYGNNSNN